MCMISQYVLRVFWFPLHEENKTKHIYSMLAFDQGTSFELELVHGAAQ